MSEMKKGRKKFECRPGHEIRGMRIRLYPDRETEEKLLVLRDDCRVAWNFLVKQVEDALEANDAYATRAGLVGPKPARPKYEGLAPDEARTALESHRDACIVRKRRVYEATRPLPECSLRKMSDMLTHFGCKFDYQLLSRVVGWRYEDGAERIIRPGAHMLQAVAKNYFQKSERRKTFKRRVDPMPIQVRSGVCFELGDFGVRGREGKSFYNCRVKINGLTIRGRLPGRAPWGRVLEGVSIIKEPDGWWASIKQEVAVRALPEAVPGSVVGIDVGLDNLVALSTGERVPNERARAYIERIAGRQAAKLPVGRLQQSAAAHTRHVIYNEVVKKLAHVEVIKVEKLPKRIGQMGSSKVSSMRTIVNILKERYGDRVVEVDPRYTSQECSQCGHRSKEAWSYEHGRYGQCPSCGYRADRDVNAARNIAKRPGIVISIEPEEPADVDTAAE